MKLFDSHAHYNDEKFDLDRDELLKKIFEGEVEKIVNAGYDVISSKLAVQIAEMYPQMFAICGVSPNNLPEIKYSIQINSNTQLLKKIEEIREIAKHEKIVGIGEIGLDYYWNKDNKELQKIAFVEQIKLANELDLPIIIHSRDAYIDTIAILKENPVNKKGIFHCCQLNKELVREALELGFFISFAGSITFKNSTQADEVIEMVPIEKMLIETDCPYLSPEPFRGQRNDSRNLVHIVKKIAKVKGLTEEEVAEATYNNATKIFEIK